MIKDGIHLDILCCLCLSEGCMVLHKGGLALGKGSLALS